MSTIVIQVTGLANIPDQGIEVCNTCTPKHTHIRMHKHTHTYAETGYTNATCIHICTIATQLSDLYLRLYLQNVSQRLTYKGMYYVCICMYVIYTAMFQSLQSQSAT